MWHKFGSFNFNLQCYRSMRFSRCLINKKWNNLLVPKIIFILSILDLTIFFPFPIAFFYKPWHYNLCRWVELEGLEGKQRERHIIWEILLKERNISFTSKNFSKRLKKFKVCVVYPKVRLIWIYMIVIFLRSSLLSPCVC